MSCWEEVRALLEEEKKYNERIGGLEYKLANAAQSLEKALSLLRRANAEITMLQARIEHCSGADKLVLCDLAFLVVEAAHDGRIKITPEHIKELRKAAKG